MAIVNLDPEDSGNTGVLAVDSVFYVADGFVDFSTDAGATYIPWGVGEKVVFSGGVTVHYRNRRVKDSTFMHMPI